MQKNRFEYGFSVNICQSAALLLEANLVVFPQTRACMTTLTVTVQS